MYKRRFLIVKRTEKLTKKEWGELVVMFGYLPELRPLWYFCRDICELFSTEQVIRLARRRTPPLKKQNYQEVPELAKSMGLLQGEKFDKMVAFLGCSEGAWGRTNNHVERANRKLRYDEKVRYKFRSVRSLDRFLRLRLGRLGQSLSPVHAPAKARRAMPSASQPVANPNLD